MKISKKAYYGLRAAVALAQADTALSIHAIAESEKLPENYLEKILQNLRRVGIVEAKKGISGGYALARPAGEISVWDILRELDGPIKTFTAPVKGTLPASNTKPARKTTLNVAGGRSFAGWPCPPSSHCQTNQVWRTLEEEIEKTLSKISISHLITTENKNPKSQALSKS